MENNNIKAVMIRISPELKTKAKQMAFADGRSLSNYILRLIEQDIAKNEYKGSKW